jgi:hypothetical protein
METHEQPAPWASCRFIIMETHYLTAALHQHLSSTHTTAGFASRAFAETYRRRIQKAARNPYQKRHWAKPATSSAGEFSQHDGQPGKPDLRATEPAHQGS